MLHGVQGRCQIAGKEDAGEAGSCEWRVPLRDEPNGDLLAAGLLTVGAVLSTTSDARTASTPTFSTFERVVEACEMLAIVPSPVIDTSGQFFFGTGDGCAGYYSQEPSQ
jgi:hypothetical protein